jgi:6-phosphogluconate dehydrogenase
MSESEYRLDLPAIARLWNQGSVVRSWLLELAADALAADPRLDELKAWVEDSGEGRWTVEDALEKAVPAPTITAALFARFRSRRANSFADRLLAALRNQFGGHAVRR